MNKMSIVVSGLFRVNTGRVVKRFSLAAVAVLAAASAWAGGWHLHEFSPGQAFRLLQTVEFPPAVTKVVLQDRRIADGWDGVDTQRPYCILEARTVTADQPTLLEADMVEHEFEFVDHKWLDLPYGAAYATSFKFKEGNLKDMTCLKPSIYAEDYMTWVDFQDVAGGILISVAGR